MDLEALEKHRKMGLSWSAIARSYGITRRRLRYFCVKNNYVDPFVVLRDLPAAILIVGPLMDEHPNCGEIILSGRLLEKGYICYRTILRAAVELVQAGGRHRRDKPTTNIVRVQYNAHGPGYLWHADTYHKIGLSAGIVIAGVVDGFSRECVALSAFGNNFASTVFDNVLPAFREKGVPRFLRIDAGMENIAMGKFMNIVRGEDSVLVGRSVNNQRIERFWRDVRVQTMDKYICFFKTLPFPDFNYREPEGIWIIHWLFLPRIQRSLSSFRGAWNNHRMRTAHYLTPLQQTLGGDRSYYMDMNVNGNAEEYAVGPLQQEYEGRATSRSSSPFITMEGELLFKATVLPLRDEDGPLTWLTLLNHAFGEALRIQQIELDL